MQRRPLRLCTVAGLGVWLAGSLPAQRAWTWPELRDRFTARNPTLRAAQNSVEEARAQEITAFLRPNPEVSFSTDGTQFVPSGGGWRPFASTQYLPNISYLVEREHKRRLRLESARGGTDIAESQKDDQTRNLLFSLRNSFVQALQAKAVLGVARESLSYYDRTLEVNRQRFRAGDIAQVDLDRLELQRVQFESDVLNAETSVRTAKIQLLMLLDDRTPVDQFDVAGTFDFAENVRDLEDLRNEAMAARPDLKAAAQGVQKAKTDHQLAIANGSTDPTFSGWITHNPSFNNPFASNTLGASVSIPLRIHDRNQGEKARTEIDIGRNELLYQAAKAQVFSDVDSANVTLNNNLNLLRPYKSKYLSLASQVRENVSFSYQHGGASLLDFLNAQNEYRNVQLNYLNLVGAYLTAANQLNLAVGREVIP
jgi:cobalt-zinc-cadmium efflux system outer membrane protein